LDNRIVKKGSLIAVSYEARAKGVKRIMRGAEARDVCPELILVQVPTAHGKADLTIYREASARIVSVLSSSDIYKSCIVERASIDEVYVDVSVDAEKLLATSTDETLREALHYLRTNSSPNIIAGEDSEEMRMSKAQIRNGHSGTSTSTNYVATSSFLVADSIPNSNESSSAGFIEDLYRQNIFLTLFSSLSRVFYYPPSRRVLV